MILYRKEPYPIQMRNVMLLDDVKSGGIVYVNKTTYDQAITLAGRLDGDPKRVLDIIRTPKNEAYRVTIGLKDLVADMMASMPKPLNMLAPFLIFCVQNQGIEWKSDDREFAYGILHQFSQMFDFNAITLVPTEVRNNINLPTAILKEYQTSWDDLCMTLKDVVVVSYAASVQPAPVIQQTAPVVQQTAPATVVQQAVSTSAQEAHVQPASSAQTAVSKQEESEEEEMARKLAVLQAQWAKEAEEEEKKREERLSKRKNESKPTTSSTTATTSKQEAAESSSVLSEFEFE